MSFIYFNLIRIRHFFLILNVQGKRSYSIWILLHCSLSTAAAKSLLAAACSLFRFLITPVMTNNNNKQNKFHFCSSVRLSLVFLSGYSQILICKMRLTTHTSSPGAVLVVSRDVVVSAFYSWTVARRFVGIVHCQSATGHSILASDAIIKIFPPQNDFTLLISAMDLFWSIFSDFTSCAIFLCFYKFIPQMNQHAKQILGLYSNNLDVRASTPNLWRVLTVPSHWQYILSYLQGLGDGHQICK